MSSINVTTITGNLGANPNLTALADGKRVAEMSIAIAGRNDRTDWIHVRVWNHTADFAARNLRKGSRVAITGRLTTDTYEVTVLRRHPETKDVYEAREKRSRTYITGTEIEPLGAPKAKTEQPEKEAVAF